MQGQVTVAHNELWEGTGAGSDFRGWIDLLASYDKEEFARIKEATEKIQSDSEVLVVIGTGGSYLGARAATDLLNYTLLNLLDSSTRKVSQIFFVGNSISLTYITDLIEVIGDRDFSINVTSKPGTATEPVIAFRVFKEPPTRKYEQEETNKRTYATIDKVRGAVKVETDTENWETFVIPDDIDGCFFILTAIDLLPIAASGANIDVLIRSAADVSEAYSSGKLEENKTYQYTVMRNTLCRKDRVTELSVNYEPGVQYFSEWRKQLYGEPEGKDQGGTYPSDTNSSTDLHFLGQFIQERRCNISKTVVKVKKPHKSIVIPEQTEDLDGLGYLQGEEVDSVNTKTFEGTLLAHTDGDTPSLLVEIPEMDTYTSGYTIHLSEIAVGISGYLNGVNSSD